MKLPKFESQTVIIAVLVCGLAAVLLWPRGEPESLSHTPSLPSVEPTVDPLSTTMVIDGITYVWISKDVRDQIEIEGHAQAIEIDRLEAEANQKNTGLEELSVEIDRLAARIVVEEGQSTRFQQQSMYWAERACDMSIYRRRQGEVDGGGADLCKSDEFWKWVPRVEPGIENKFTGSEGVNK